MTRGPIQAAAPHICTNCLQLQLCSLLANRGPRRASATRSHRPQDSSKRNFQAVASKSNLGPQSALGIFRRQGVFGRSPGVEAGCCGRRSSRFGWRSGRRARCPRDGRRRGWWRGCRTSPARQLVDTHSTRAFEPQKMRRVDGFRAVASCCMCCRACLLSRPISSVPSGRLFAESPIEHRLGYERWLGRPSPVYGNAFASDSCPQFHRSNLAQALQGHALSN